VLAVYLSLRFLAIAHCKNVSGPTASSGGTLGGDGGDDTPRRSTAAEKGKGKKVMTKKRKASDREAEIAEAVAAATEATKRGGRSGALRIGSDLTLGQMHAVLEAEQRHGTPPAIMLGGRRVRINVTELKQEDTKSEGQAEPVETEAEAQAEGQTQV
jgi:hypothetical protein